MSRGQQGIGISAAGMYGLLTTGEPVQIISRTNPNKPANHHHVQIDTAKNRPQIVLDEDCEFELPTGTSVTITLEGKYQKGRQSVDEYISQTAMANPHAKIIYNAPDGNTYEYPRRCQRACRSYPKRSSRIRMVLNLGLLIPDGAGKPVQDACLNFCSIRFRASAAGSPHRLLKRPNFQARLHPSKMTLQEAEALHAAINETKIMAPPSDCIGPIGDEQLEQGLRRVVEAEFYAASSRQPAVYRGNPFLIEAAIAYGVKGQAATMKKSRRR